LFAVTLHPGSSLKLRNKALKIGTGIGIRFPLVLLFLFKLQNVTYYWVYNFSCQFANQFLKRKLWQPLDVTAYGMFINWCYHNVSI
jgi:hypothetical protein